MERKHMASTCNLIEYIKKMKIIINNSWYSMSIVSLVTGNLQKYAEEQRYQMRTSCWFTIHSGLNMSMAMWTHQTCWIRTHLWHSCIRLIYCVIEIRERNKKNEKNQNKLVAWKLMSLWSSYNKNEQFNQYKKGSCALQQFSKQNILHKWSRRFKIVIVMTNVYVDIRLFSTTILLIFSNSWNANYSTWCW